MVRGPPGAPQREPGAERHHHRRQLGGRIGMREAPAERAARADLGMADEGQGQRHQGAALANQRGPLQRALAGEGADLQAAVGAGDHGGELGHAIDVDHVARPDEAEVEHWHQALPAGQDLRRVAVAGQEPERLLDRGGVVIAETGRLHRGETRPPPGQSQGIDWGAPGSRLPEPTSASAERGREEGDTPSDLRPRRRGQAAGRRPLGSAGIALRRGLRPQHPHGRRARGLGPHPRSRPRGAGLTSTRSMSAAAPVFSASSWRAGASRHRRGLRARDGRRGAAQGGGARRGDPDRGGRRRAAPVCARQLRPRHQPPRALDAPAPGGGDRRVDPRSPAGRAPCHRRRAVRRRRPGEGPPVVPGRAASTRRSATSSHSSAVGRGRRSKHC